MNSIEQQLRGLRRGLSLIESRRSRDDRQVMLGYVFKDLDALRDRVSTAAPLLRERYAAMVAEALKWRARVGAPVEPDAAPGGKPTRRPRKSRSARKKIGLLGIPILETERLRLRPFGKGDLDDYAALNSDPEVLRHLGTGSEPWDRFRSSRHLAFLAGHWYFWDAGMWAVEHRESGAFMGMVGFAAPEGWPGFELAWIFARRFWGHGYGTEGAAAALAHAFKVWKKERVISLIFPENRASIRVAERIGERLQEKIIHFGREMLCYGIDRETYFREVDRVA